MVSICTRSTVKGSGAWPRAVVSNPERSGSLWEAQAPEILIFWTWEEIQESVNVPRQVLGASMHHPHLPQKHQWESKSGRIKSYGNQETGKGKRAHLLD
jgi:hypothetical protein